MHGMTRNDTGGFILFKKITAVLIFACTLISGSTTALAQQSSGPATSTPTITAQPLPTLSPAVQGAMRGTSMGPTPSLQQVTPQQMEAYQNLSPSQRGAIEAELSRTGGQLTPAAIEALKARPEFRGLSAEEIARGRQLLEQREKTEDKPAEQKIRTDSSKLVIGGEAKGVSLFDRSRSTGKYQSISLDLQPFGYEFFGQAAVRVATERKDIPVPLKYVIGPGDEVKLLLWGRVNAQFNLTVDRDGKITIPQIGPLFVAGMTFEDMSKHIIKQSEQIVGANVDITLGSLKTIPIFVLGDVRRPGAYTIGSFATITDALLLAGGPSEIGTMRHIQLKRKGQLVTTFDLYDLLLKGDKTKDAILMAGDVVFVPVTGPLVGIAGNVKRPAIYELRDRHDLESVLDLAGGIIPTAYTQQIQLERIIRNERQVVFDIDDKKMEEAKAVRLQDADLVKVFSIVDMNVNVVYLNGNVKRPGKYEIKPGMRLVDLIKGVDDLLPETHFDYALIKRLNPPGMETVLIPFHLGRLLLVKDPAQNVELKPQDRIFVFNRWFFKDKPTIEIEGEIRAECNAEQGAIKGQKLLDTMAMATELKIMEDDLLKEGLNDLAVLVRNAASRIASGGTINRDSISALQKELNSRGQIVFSARLMELETKIKNSCKINLAEGMRVNDAILIAGGLSNNSYLEKGQIIRRDEKRSYQTIYFNVSQAMAGKLEENILLQDEDRIVIHSIWEQVYKKNVSIDGDVHNPGTFQYTEGMTVKDLVFKGGNITESAFVDEAEISSVIVDDRRIFRTQRKIINLRKALEGDPANNIPLKPYDRLLVKRIPDWGRLKYITLTGEFKFPGRYAIEKGERLSSVIERAGGYTSHAYLRAAYFTRNTVRVLQQKSLEDMTRRMERELLSESSSRVGSSVTGEEIQAKGAETLAKQKLIEYMKSLKATGRMTIAMSHLRVIRGGPFDVELEDGDTLDLPKKTSVVNVVGAVMSEGSHIYNDKWGYQDYITVTGGYARYADESNIFVIKVDGSARKLSKGFMEWSDNRERWEVAGYGEKIRQIEPGDVIVVPEKLTTIAWLRDLKDITQILMNTAVVAGVAIKMF